MGYEGQELIRAVTDVAFVVDEFVALIRVWLIVLRSACVD